MSSSAHLSIPARRSVRHVGYDDVGDGKRDFDLLIEVASHRAAIAGDVVHQRRCRRRWFVPLHP